MPHLLELRDLRKCYGDFVAVDALDLQIPRGCVYGVLGPNGAGKSTTIRMIMNIYVPDAGEILFDGRPLDRAATDRITYLPEERGLYRKMPVRDHLVYLARLKGMDRRRAESDADRWLERFDLADRALTRVDELSKGMQQKLQFIATVLPEPELIILDEPFSGLDPLNVRLLTGIIEEMNQRGTTVLFSTHVLEQAEKTCDHIFLMHRGKKVLDGRLEEIRDSYPVEKVRVSGEFDPSQLSGLPGVRAVEPRDHGMELRLEEGADHQRLLKALLGRGQVNQFVAAKPSLTDIFIHEVEARGMGIDDAERHSAQAVGA